MRDQLESRLRAERDRLDIDQPPLTVIHARAGALRRRRTAARAGVAALAVLAVSAVAVAGLRGGHEADPVPAATVAPSDPAGVWSAAGITINGLPHLPRDLPGQVRDAAFLDADRGFLLSSDCLAGCTAWISATTDGGRSWRTAPAPFDDGDTVARTADGTHLVVMEKALAAGWLGPENAPACGGRTRAAQQPPITVCWWSPVRAGDGSWWVGGRTPDGHPAVSVTRDGGAIWTTTEFPGPAGATARVALQGHSVIVTVVAPVEHRERLLAVVESADGGVTFGAPRPVASEVTIGGDLVPLLDGRLLIVDGDPYGYWLVSEDRGATWRRLLGLHSTTRIERTQGGYVALGMATIYTAFSSDGATWQKLDAQ